MTTNRKKTKKVALGGIVTLFSVVSLYVTTIIPTNRLFFLALSSFFISLIVIEYGNTYAFLTYLASSMLSLLIVPSKSIVLMYILFFGYYAILKGLIEKIDKLLIELIIKIMVFNIAIAITYFTVSKFFFDTIAIEIPLWLLIIVFEILFLIYDYCFSLAIHYYITSIKNKLMK